MDTPNNDEYEEFKKLYQTDLTWAQIKEKLQITTYCLETFVNKIKSEGIISRKDKKASIKAQAILLRQTESLSSSQIAKRLGIDKRTAYAFVHGIPSLQAIKCESCNTLHNCDYGEGRFCKDACARIFASNLFNREEYWSNTENKIAFKNNLKHKQRHFFNLECKFCKQKYKSKKSGQKYCSRECVHLCEEHIEKCKKITAARILNGTHKGWSTRKKLEPSFPEKWFIDYLRNKGLEENVDYERELKCGKYFIDFAFAKYLFAIEIDGKQHTYTERKEKDKAKDQFLHDEGWTVFRISWRGIVNEKKYHAMLADIGIVMQKMGIKD